MRTSGILCNLHEHALPVSRFTLEAVTLVFIVLYVSLRAKLHTEKVLYASVLHSV